MSVSLVLEGGGMRGTYSTGVIDFLHDEQIQFDYCYGVSAGSGHACSFLSKQRGRAFRVVVNNINKPEYAGVKVLLKLGNFFNLTSDIHPDEDIFDNVIRNEENDPSEILFIDDGAKNVEMARRKGFNAILVKEKEDWRHIFED